MLKFKKLSEYIKNTNGLYIMITVSKGLSPPVLAQGWMNDLGARPDMSIKVGFLSHDMRIAGRIVGVQSTEQSV